MGKKSSKQSKKKIGRPHRKDKIISCVEMGYSQLENGGNSEERAEVRDVCRGRYPFTPKSKKEIGG